MTHTTSGIIYLLAGLAIIYLFQERRKSLKKLTAEQIPELEPDDFDHLRILLKTAYERMLYLGVMFLPLAFTSFHGGIKTSQIFFLLLIFLLFISNIPPRHKISKFLEQHDLSVHDLKMKGIRL